MELWELPTLVDLQRHCFVDALSFSRPQKINAFPAKQRLKFPQLYLSYSRPRQPTAPHSTRTHPFACLCPYCRTQYSMSSPTKKAIAPLLRMSSGALEVFRDIAIARTAGHRFSDQEIETEALRDIMALTQRYGARKPGPFSARVDLCSHAAAAVG